MMVNSFWYKIYQFLKQRVNKQLKLWVHSSRISIYGILGDYQTFQSSPDISWILSSAASINERIGVGVNSENLSWWCPCIRGSARTGVGLSSTCCCSQLISLDLLAFSVLGYITNANICSIYTDLTSDTCLLLLYFELLMRK